MSVSMGHASPRGRVPPRPLPPSLVSVLSALLAMSPPAPSFVRAADWYVAPAPPGGDGSAAKPFHDPWKALHAASAGDTVHIAEGVYHGRLDRSSWEIDRPRLTLLGGYDRGFSRRDPWRHPTVLAHSRDYEGAAEHSLLIGRDDHSGAVIDGLVFDGGGRNRYDPKPPSGLRGGLAMVGPLVSLASPDVTVRNCILLNSQTGAAEFRGEGLRFENNLVLNHRGPPMLAVRDSGAAAGFETAGVGKRPMIIRGNTLAFAHDETDPPMGRGGEKGIAVRVATAAQIENNVFLACGNAAILLAAKPERIAIDGNVFWLPLRANVALRDGTKELLIADKNLEEMEDLGLKSCKGNRAVECLPTGLKAEWVDGVTRNLLLAHARPPKEAVAALRSKYGLGEPAEPKGNDIGPIAPYLDPRDGCAVRVPDDLGAGARPVELKATPAAAAPAAAPREYTRLEWAELNAGAAGLDGKPVEVRVGVGQERHGFVLKDVTAERFVGFDVYHPGGDRLPDRIHVYAVRGGPAHRQWQEAAKSNGPQQIEDWYLLRGTCRLTGARQKATIEVEAVVPAEPPPRAAAARPRGRDWYVRAGAAGGDGSREKPFRDPFQPLEKAAPGDSIHVAGGDYFGKLRTANWKVAAKHLTLLGGYDAGFRARDPWRNPARLVMTPDAGKADRGRHSGTFLESSQPCDGLVVDGFVFDGSAVNNYHDAAAGGGLGGLDLRGTPTGPMVQLRGLELAVRNCVFVNAAACAADLGAAAGTFENNVVVNSCGIAVSISASGPGPWTVRGNTILFALDPSPRAGTGRSAAGTLLMIRGRAAVRLEGNILAFADNCGVRSTVPWHKFAVEGNAFAADLHCHLTDGNRVWLYDAVWDRRLADSPLASARGNSVSLPPGLAVDREYADKALPRLFGLKGRYRRADWERIAAAVGATVKPPPDPAEPADAAPPAEPPKPEKAKEPSLEDLAAELDKLKNDRAKNAEAAKDKDAAAAKGPPFAPAYPWRKALELAREPQPGSAASPGAHRRPLPAPSAESAPAPAEPR